jgi:cell division protein FtsB
MESQEFNTTNNKENSFKKWVVILAILSGLLLISTLYFAFWGTPTMNTQYIEVEQSRDYLQTELDNLLKEHDRIKAEYGDLSDQLSEKDSIILANADEIKKLINSQGDYNQIKRQLARLQNIAQEYVKEMDKLYEENQALKEENTQVKETLTKTREHVATIEKDKDDMNKKISGAAIYKAYNITAKGVAVKKNNIEVEADKSRKIDRFRISFILGENPLIEPSNVNVYCRIAIPETGRILMPGNAEAYSFMFEGQRLQYTMKTTVNYVGKTEVISLFWDIRDDDKVIKGTYPVTLYTDNQFLGEAFIVVK